MTDVDIIFNGESVSAVRHARRTRGAILDVGDAARHVGRVGTPALRALDGSLSRVAHVGRQAAVGIGVTTAAAGVLATVLGVKAVKEAGSFEVALDDLGSSSGATARQMAALEKQAMRAGAQTKFSAMDAVEAQTALAKGGLALSRILGGGLDAALALAAAGEMELGAAAETTVNAMKQFNLDGKEAMQVADALATASLTTTANVSDFAAALNNGASSANTAGLSFRETVSWLEALADKGIKGAEAGTQIKSALLALANPSKKAAAEAKELGLTFFDQQGQMKPLPQLAADLGKAFDGLSQKERLQSAARIAGSYGLSALLALYEAGPKKIKGYGDELAKQGVAAGVAAEKQDNLFGSIEKLQGSVETAAIIFGDAFIPTIREATEGLDAFLDKAIQDGTIERWAKVTGDALQGAFELGVQGVDAIEEAWDDGRIQSVAEGVAGAVEHAFDFGEDIWDSGAIQDGAETAKGFIEDIGDAWPEVKTQAMDAIEGILSRLDRVLDLGEDAARALGDGFAEVAPVAGEALDGILNTAERIGPEVGKAFETIVASVEPISGAVEPVVDILEGLVETFGGENLVKGAAAFVAIKTALSGMAAINAAGIAGVVGAIAGPAGIATLGAGAAIGIMAIADGMTSVAEEARDAADALNTVMEAQAALRDAEIGVRRAEFDLKDAQTAHTDAVDDAVTAQQRYQDTLHRTGARSKETAKAAEDVADAQDKVARSVVDVDDAQLRLEEAHKRVDKSQREVTRGAEDLAKQFRGQVTTALEKADKALGQTGGTARQVEARQQLAARAAGDLAANIRDQARAAEGATDQSIALADSVADYIESLGTIPDDRTTELIATDLASGDIERLRARLASLPRVVNTTVYVNYVTRGSPRVDDFNVTPTGHAAGTKTRQGRAEVAVIGEGSKPEYVIPTEEKHRGRALGLFLSLAKDLGVQALAAGGRFVGGQADPDAARRAVQAAEDGVKGARERIDNWQDAARDVAEAKRREGSGTVNARRKQEAIAGAEKRLDALAKTRWGDLGERRAALRRANAELKQARQNLAAIGRYEERLGVAGDEADVAGSEMDLAQGVDEAAFSKAKAGQRAQLVAQIAQLEKTLHPAKGKPPTGARARDLRKRLADAKLALRRLDETKFEPERAGGDLALTTDDLDLAEAKARLTVDTADDAQVRGQRRDFLGGLLKRTDLTTRERADVTNRLADLQEKVGSGGGDPDLQARNVQLERQLAAKTEENRLIGSFRAVVGQSADQGYYLVQGMRVSGSAGERAVASLAAGGFGQQGSVPPGSTRSAY